MKSTQTTPALKILIIRRDNIGDLVCSTPLFAALRQHFPHAELCALVNSYNVAVLENNPDIDTVYAYTKAKHRAKGQSVIRVYWNRFKLFAKLRKQCFDYTILAGSPASVPRALKLARMIRPRHIIAYGTDPSIDLPLPYPHGEATHEAEDVFNLLAPLGISGNPPPLAVHPDPTIAEKARSTIVPEAGHILVGVHISARKPSQRWDAARFTELIRKLAAGDDMSFVLFWSPGDEANPLHPGDDRKAKEILDALAGAPVTAYPTNRLQELIAGLSLCDAVICSDGGAMHLAAGLGKPILCFFGKSNSAHWRPWGVPHVLLQPPTQDVADISVEDALKGFNELRKKASLSRAI